MRNAAEEIFTKHLGGSDLHRREGQLSGREDMVYIKALTYNKSELQPEDPKMTFL